MADRKRILIADEDGGGLMSALGAMARRVALLVVALPLLGALCVAARAADADESSGSGRFIHIRPKNAPTDAESAAGEGVHLPEMGVIDAPTAAVLDHGGYGTQTRFYANGGLLQYLSFGVYPRLNLGASLSIDGLIGDGTIVRARLPQAQVKFRFYDGDRYLPALAAGYDGQGYNYSQPDQAYNERQRGFYLVGTQELGLPGLQAHPSFNISNFNSNSIFGSIPLTYNIRDKVVLLFEWDNINNFDDSRVNAGLRVYLVPNLSVDFAVRRIGQGGFYDDGSPRGPERVVQFKYSGSF